MDDVRSAVMSRRVYKSEDFDAVLLCAVRYCLGRRTYMPDLVTKWIMGTCNHKLSPNTIKIMLRDINDQRKMGDKALGDPCDIQTWNTFEKWLKEQQNA